jgi:hypothetical protein
VYLEKRITNKPKEKPGFPWSPSDPTGTGLKNTARHRNPVLHSITVRPETGHLTFREEAYRGPDWKSADLAGRIWKITTVIKRDIARTDLDTNMNLRYPAIAISRRWNCFEISAGYSPVSFAAFLYGQ